MVYGKIREEVHDKWLTLHAAAKRGPVVTKVPTLAEYLAYWLAEVIKPNREPNTYSQYELFSRRYVIPGLGSKRVDRLTVRDVQVWLNKLPGICQCCTQGKDANRREDKALSGHRSIWTTRSFRLNGKSSVSVAS